MPPTRTPKIHIYAITRRDFDHHTDKKGRLCLIEKHSALNSANEAAKLHPQREYAKGEFNADLTEDVNKDGVYDGWGYVMQDRRNHFCVEVKKMELKGGKMGDAKGKNVPDVGVSATVAKVPAKEDGTKKQPVVS